MNEAKQPVPCSCAVCQGKTCTCGCQQPAARSACACGPQCACGTQCACGQACACARG
ncbi:MAG: hypothetical protein ACXWCE_20260 [Caldimonas sp.]